MTPRQSFHVLKSALIALVCAAIAPTALATDRHFRDTEATSRDGRFLFTAHSPDNDRSPMPPFQSDFCLTLTDTSTDEVLWTRENTRWQPTEIWVDETSAVVINTGGSSFVAFDAITGEVVIEARLPDLLRPEDFDGTRPNRVTYSTAGPLWTQNAHFGFFEHDGDTFFGCRTGWDRVWVLDLARKKSITDPPKRIVRDFDDSLRATARRVLHDAPTRPDEIRGPNIYEFSQEVAEALDLAGRLQVREAIEDIRTLELIEPAGAGAIPVLDPSTLDSDVRIRPYRLRQWVRTALRRLDEVPQPLPVSYAADDFWGPATGSIPIPPDRSARADALVDTITQTNLVRTLGPPDAIIQGPGYSIQWQYEIDDPKHPWILNAEFNLDDPTVRCTRIRDLSMLRVGPNEREGDFY